MVNQVSTWFRESLTAHVAQECQVTDIVYSTQSPFQRIQVIETLPFGRALLLDGKIQSSEMDEFIYHEVLVHPLMITHPSPERVFIAGGGEGATLREVLSHQTVKKVVMVDIDEEVIEVSRKYLASWHQGSFDDPRTELRHEDAREYLSRTDMTFDIIIIDLADPSEGNPATLLYTREFYQLALERLTPQGMITTQAELACYGMAEAFKVICNTMEAVAPKVYPYHISIPSFGGDWGFVMGSRSLDPTQLSPQEVDRAIAARTSRSLKAYDGIIHQGIFALPKELRQQIKAETKVITEREPLFVI